MIIQRQHKWQICTFCSISKLNVHLFTTYTRVHKLTGNYLVHTIFTDILKGCVNQDEIIRSEKKILFLLIHQARIPYLRYFQAQSPKLFSSKPKIVFWAGGIFRKVFFSMFFYFECEASKF